MRLTAVLQQDLETELEIALVVRDPSLHEVRSVNGRVRFLQMALIAPDEEELIARWDAVRFSEELSAVTPMFVTELTRRSLLASDHAVLLRAAAKRDGSSRELEYLRQLDEKFEVGMNKQVRLTLKGFEADLIARVLEMRVAHRRRARLAVGGLTIALLSTDDGFEPWTAATEDQVSIALPPERVPEMVACLTARRAFSESWFRELTIEHQRA